MARVAGIDLPPQKRAQIGLTYIYGIGKTRATNILGEAQIDVNKKIRELSEDELNRVRTIIEAQGNVEGDLRKSRPAHCPEAHGNSGCPRAHRRCH